MCERRLPAAGLDGMLGMLGNSIDCSECRRRWPYVRWRADMCVPSWDAPRTSISPPVPVRRRCGRISGDAYGDEVSHGDTISKVESPTIASAASSSTGGTATSIASLGVIRCGLPHNSISRSNMLCSGDRCRDEVRVIPTYDGPVGERGLDMRCWAAPGLSACSAPERADGDIGGR